MNAPAVQTQKRQFDRPKAVYTTIKDFTDPESKVTVRLQRSSDYPRPRYSVSVGRLQDSTRDGATEQRLVPFLPVRVQTHLAKVQTLTAFSSIVGQLLNEAEEYIHNEAQLTEDQILESQINKDEKWANRGKPQAKHTGKTERERNKRKNTGNPS
jgi:hypothetical protein